MVAQEPAGNKRTHDHLDYLSPARVPAGEHRHPPLSHAANRSDTFNIPARLDALENDVHELRQSQAAHRAEREVTMASLSRLEIMVQDCLLGVEALNRDIARSISKIKAERANQSRLRIDALTVSERQGRAHERWFRMELEKSQVRRHIQSDGSETRSVE
ncbi:hypothetical protein BOTBODRAFT_181846 [Botryobasidium botryosum FD-172 SS1]|uniref:Uncharacterized protein n=1 Tax=Botryobasidium botryosum (strain FD-172 SS1) TaxID=930990 RepID=A0A067M3L6_BOTB1|nr:hypothetical protein BOTBODRAFT_181846 [Botryobasidium botryosum FD-172 SS1]